MHEGVRGSKLPCLGDNKAQKKGKLTAEDVQEMLRDAVGTLGK